jgi:very-short-patch-repair endonuclease
LDHHKSPEKKPELKSEIRNQDENLETNISLLDANPNIQIKFDSFVETIWKSWSRCESQRRRTIGIYNNLFTVQRATAGGGSEAPIELVWGIGCAVWKKRGSDKLIRHPLITQSCEIYLDPEDFSLRVRPRNADPHAELDCYEELDIPGVAEVDQIWRKEAHENAVRVNPFDNSSFEAILRYAVLNLDPEGSYVSGQIDKELPIPSDKLTITDTWVIFARKRSEHILIDDTNSLSIAIENASELEPGVASFVEHGSDLVHDQDPVSFRGLSNFDYQPNARELYFPMPFNDEQLSIMQRLEKNAAVVVQGPPGTGKTHTIANVICHYLAEGKRVLVTAKSDSALAVLQEKIPDEIRTLTVALLSDERGGMKQFEHSIQTIGTKLSSFNPSATQTTVEGLEHEINTLHARIQKIDQELRNIGSNHLSQSYLLGKAQLPEEIARFVLEGESAHSWFKDVLDLENPAIDFSDADIASIRKARMAVLDDLASIDETIPSVDELPIWKVIEELHEDLSGSSEIRTRINEGELLRLIYAGYDALTRVKALNLEFKHFDDLTTDIDEARINWLDSHTQALLDRGGEHPIVSQLAQLGEEIRRLEEVSSRYTADAIVVPRGFETDPEFSKAIERLAQGKRASIWPLGSRKIKEQIAQITIKGFEAQSSEDWLRVQELVAHRNSMKRLFHAWNAIGSKLGLPEVEADDLDSLERLVKLQKHLGLVHERLLVVQPRIQMEAKELFDVRLNFNEIDEAKRSLLRKSIKAHIQKHSLADATNRVDELTSRLRTYSSSIAEGIIRWLETELVNPAADKERLEHFWTLTRKEVLRLNNLRTHFDEIDRVASLVERSGALIWANKLRETPSDEGNDSLTPNNWRDAMTWRAAHAMIERIDAHDVMKTLFNQRKKYEAELARAYRNIVANKTWIGVHRKAPASTRQALQAYLNAVQSMGSGQGKRAARYRRNAKSAMEKAYSAVPCWIMPQWRVSESIPPELALFDLVVIDEASQSDIWALPCLLRGKQFLIVGDHKQVSPSAVGMQEAKIIDLSRRFLNDQPHGDQMSPEKSIYDLATVVFAGSSVMLKEHFRCVPAIIEFSNQHFYNGEIKPLRLPKSNERLNPPLIDVFVEGGFRKRDTNPPEAQAIVNEIKALIEDPNMDGRSIGVVTLVGMEQAKYIWNLINNQIPQDQIIARQIEVGAPPAFQGRERDIILISNVLAEGNRTAANKIDITQRLNVAMSRARDRMYLFRSVHESDFAADTLTAKTIRHFKAPFRQDPVQSASLRSLCESDFEREMFDLLIAKNYRVRPQVRCGSYRIDFVVEGDEGRRLAVECDGDRFHGPGQWIDDMQRQRVLERAGWTFWRCFASSFVMNKEAVVSDLIETLTKLGIDAFGSESVDNTRWTESRTVNPMAIQLEEGSEDETDSGTEIDEGA